MIVQITCAKVGHRQAPFKQKPSHKVGLLFAMLYNEGPVRLRHQREGLWAIAAKLTLHRQSTLLREATWRQSHVTYADPPSRLRFTRYPMHSFIQTSGLQSS